VDGDGYADVVVSAPDYDHGEEDEGRVFVYPGGPSGLAATAAWTAEGDQAGAHFGWSVGTAGDVNGDGYADVIVGAPWYDNGEEDEGRAFVYPGGPSGLAATAAWTAEGDQVEAFFGWSVGTAGDVNGDGYADVVVGAYGYDNDETDEGRAFVYHGGPSGLAATAAWTAESDQAGALFGVSVGTAGDVNGDGYADVIVGAPWYDNGATDEGRAFVYHGGPSGLAATAAWTAEGDQADAYLGRSVGTAGDVNGDGYADVVVGAYGYDETGRAWVYQGNDGGGLHLLPRQLRSDGSAPVAHLGLSDSPTRFQLRLIGRMPLGREEVRLQWQVAPLGTPITATHVLSGTSGWTDVLTTGVEIRQTVTGLTGGTPYHWRVRLLYRPGNALGQPASRWIHIPWAGWNETDLRTPNRPPVADAGPDQTVSPGAAVTLDGRGSYDPDGSYPLAYGWSQTGGPGVSFAPSLSVTTFTAPPGPAVLTFSLVVTDTLGLPDPTPDQVVVSVGYGNYLPLVMRNAP
jgi:hypothetical protein